MGALRAIARVTVFMMLASIACGCHSYRRVPNAAFESDAREIKKNDKIRFVGRDGTRREMIVHEMQYPIVTGYEVDGGGNSLAVTVNLNEVQMLEISRVNHGASFLVLVGISVVVTYATLMGMIGVAGGF